MPNQYFQFRQFLVNQDQCAMKVTTDACILGARAANHATGARRILDIGAGTGLLMLMVAQKNEAAIEGIEIEPACYKQLKENIAASKWRDRLQVVEGDVSGLTSVEPYDFIVSNPPFYEGELASPEKGKNLARHSSRLTLSGLLEAIDRLLTADGSFIVLLPAHRLSEFTDMATRKKFYLREECLVRQSPLHSPFRGILHFSRQAGASIKKELIIQLYPGLYTPEFIELLRDYYLNL